MGTANEPISAGEIAPSSGMAEYKIIVDGPRRYGVEVTSPDRFLSVRGFATELDAAMWIAEQKAGEAAAAAPKGPPPKNPWAASQPRASLPRVHPWRPR